MKKRVYLDTCGWCKHLFEILRLRRVLNTEECLTYLQIVTPKIGDAHIREKMHLWLVQTLCGNNRTDSGKNRTSCRSVEEVS